MSNRYNIDDLKNNLRKFRLSQNMTVREFSDAIGVSTNYFLWETGKSSIPTNTLIHIANTFDVDINIFFTNNEKNEPYKFQEIKSSVKDLKKYDGKPIYIYPNNSVTSFTGWGIIDCKNKQVICKNGEILLFKYIRDHKLYVLPNSINEALFFDKLLTLNEILNLNQVWVEFVENRTLQSKFVGWYKVLPNKNEHEVGFLQNGNYILDLCYYGKNFVCYENCYPDTISISNFQR